MAVFGAPRSGQGLENPELSASIRRASRRDDLETVSLLGGILAILLMAVVIFGVTSPLG